MQYLLFFRTVLRYWVSPNVPLLKTRADSLTDKFQHASQWFKELQVQVRTLELSNVNLHNKLGLFEKSIAELTARSETTESVVSDDNLPFAEKSSV